MDLNWFELLIVTALSITLIVNRGIELLKPLFGLLEKKLANLDPEVVRKIMFSVYLAVSFGLGTLVAALNGLTPFAFCPACPSLFGEIPLWVGYLTFGAFVALGEETLHALLKVIRMASEWLDSAKKV